MSRNHPLAEILTIGRPYWGRPEIRAVVRNEFDKVCKCRTAALGATVFASEAETKVVFDACKSRACPPCGHRRTLLWQRDQWAALPDIPYVHIALSPFPAGVLGLMLNYAAHSDNVDAS